MDGVAHTVETLSAEIGRLVAERQALRGALASWEQLESNRLRLARSQALLTRLLIERHRGRARAA